MLKAKKSKKPLIITLSVILGIIFIFAAYLGIYYLCADALIYHYVDLSAEVKFCSTYDKDGEIWGRGIKYPFFGNPLTISEEWGPNIGLPLGAGETNIVVYDVLNGPIVSWVYYMRYRYKNNASVDYTVDMDKEHITVNFNGTLTENGKAVPIEQKFSFSIANASPENLPVWLNKEDISEGFDEYLTYLDDNEKVPEWMKNNRPENLSA